jgi:hypothetical protein
MNIIQSGFGLALVALPKLAAAALVALPFGPPLNKRLVVPRTYYFDSRSISKRGTLARGELDA